MITNQGDVMEQTCGGQSSGSLDGIPPTPVVCPTLSLALPSNPSMHIPSSPTTTQNPAPTTENGGQVQSPPQQAQPAPVLHATADQIHRLLLK